MLHDWIELGGVEIGNTERTAVYARQFGLPWFRGCQTCDDGQLGAALQAMSTPTYLQVLREHPTYQDVLDEHPTYQDLLQVQPGETDGYNSPQQDQPPWYDPDNADTWGFLGFYPLDISGTDDETSTARVLQRTGVGGVVQPPRAASREMVVRGLLIGLDDASVQVGMSWLRSALLDPHCDVEVGCFGATLRLFAACPVLCDTHPACIDDCAAPYIREFYDVHLTSGPEVLARYSPQEGSFWEVQFTLTAGIPYAYGPETIVYDPTVPPAPLWGPFLADEFAPEFDLGGGRGGGVVAQQRIGAVVDAQAQPLVDCSRDPACTPPSTFPGYEQAPLGCYPQHNGAFRRRLFIIPEKSVPTWSTAMPILRMGASQTIRDIRLKFYSQRSGDAEISDAGVTLYQPTAEVVVTYLPANATLTVDTPRQQIVMTCGGQQVDARHVIGSLVGGRTRFPTISCGDKWVMSLEVPDTVPEAVLSAMDVGLRLRVRDG